MMKYNVELEKDKPCWLKKYGCPCSTGGCYGLPDEGCPVYQWFMNVMDYHKRKVSTPQGE